MSIRQTLLAFGASEGVNYLVFNKPLLSGDNLKSSGLTAGLQFLSDNILTTITPWLPLTVRGLGNSYLKPLTVGVSYCAVDYFTKIDDRGILNKFLSTVGSSYIAAAAEPVLISYTTGNRN